MRREGDRVKMEVLFDFKAVRTKEGVSDPSAKAHMDYDCAKPRYEGLAVLYYSGNMGNGNVLDRSSGKGKWLRISPGSLDDSVETCLRQEIIAKADSRVDGLMIGGTP